MRIKFTVVPNYNANSHILVYFRPAYVLNTSKWNDESTDYYRNIIEESTYLTPEIGRNRQLSCRSNGYSGKLVSHMRTTNARRGYRRLCYLFARRSLASSMEKHL